MFKMLEGLVEVVTNIVNFFVDLLKGIIDAILLVGKAATFVTSSLIMLPPQYSLLLGLIIAYLVIYLVIKLGG